MNNNIPLVDKYRPKHIQSIVNQDEIKKVLFGNTHPFYLNSLEVEAENEIKSRNYLNAFKIMLYALSFLIHKYVLKF